MAVPSRGGRTTATTTTEVVQVHNKRWKDHGRGDVSPERTMVWMEPKSTKTRMERRVPVVYYLSKDGHLEHPHFIEVPLSSTDGLYLRDVINRLNSLRGKGMASMYSWSSKRSYKNGFVWHDLSENDFIYPAHGQEYVLKGSEFLESSMISYRSDQETESSSSSEKLLPEMIQKSSGESSSEFPVLVQRRNQSWSSVDLHEYKVYKTESTGEFAGKAADAATQTDEKRRRRRLLTRDEQEDDEDQEQEKKTPPPPSFAEEEQQQQRRHYENLTTELSREEISPPPSSSSPETLESLIKSEGRISNSSISESDIRNQTAVNNHPSGRVRASMVLRQLISCGSLSVKDCGSVTGRDQRLSLLSSHCRARFMPHEGEAPNHQAQESSFIRRTNPNPNPNLEEYLSGSLMESNKDDFAAASSSYSADDRSSELEVVEKLDEESEGVPKENNDVERKPKAAVQR